MMDVELLEGMRAAASDAALRTGAEAEQAERIAQEVVVRLIRRGIADLTDPIAYAAALGAGAATVHGRGHAA